MCWVTELRCCRNVNVILYVSWTSQGSTLLCFSYCLYTLTAEAFTSVTSHDKNLLKVSTADVCPPEAARPPSYIKGLRISKLKPKFLQSGVDDAVG